MFLRVQNHLIDLDILRHVTVMPPVLVIDIGNTEDIQIDFPTAEEAQETFDAISALLQAQSADGKSTKMNDKGHLG
jgi:hypothetical protein